MALTPQQIQALFTTLSEGTGATFDAATPGMSQQERNQYINQYGPGGTNYGEYLDWYANGRTYAGSGAGASTGWSGTTAGGEFSGQSVPAASGSASGMKTNSVPITSGGTGEPSASVSGGSRSVGGAGGLGGAPTTAARSPTATSTQQYGGVRTVGGGGGLSNLPPGAGTGLPGTLNNESRQPAGTTPSAPVGSDYNRTQNSALPPGGTPTGTPGTTTGDAGGLGINSGSYPTSTAKWTAPTGPAVSAGNPMDFYADEGYQFRLKEGKNAIQNSAAARGGLQSGNTLKELEKFASGLASQEYGAAFDRFSNQRNFNQGVFTDARNFDRGTFESDRGFDESGRRFNLGFDYGVAKDDRDFNESGRRYDQGFNYNAALNDKNFDYNSFKDLANMGLSASGSNAQLATALAAILSQNTLAGAGAGAAGATGGANVTSQMVQNIINYLQQNKIISSLPNP